MRAAKTILTAFVTGALFFGGCSTQQELEQGSANQTEMSTHLFSCETNKPMADGVRHTMNFAVVGLDQPGFDEDFLWPEDEEGAGDCPECPITVDPADSPFMALNENAVVMRDNGKLIVEGDADGFYWVTLVMYENSGYTKGYVRVEDGGGYVDEFYSTARCTVSTQSVDQPAAPSEMFGFYVNDDFMDGDGEPLMVALYPPVDSQEVSAGFVDFAPFNADAETTDLLTGVFRLQQSDGVYELVAETDDGAPMTASSWNYQNRVLTINGVSLNRRYQLDPAKYIKQCYALQVLEYEFDEAFTTFEYPGVDVAIDGAGNYEVSLGCVTYDGTEAEIVVSDNVQGDFEATVITEYSTYVLRVPAGAPSRGQVLAGDSLDDLRVIANVGCYQ